MGNFFGISLSLQFRQVGQILRPCDSAFVLNQLCSAQKENGNAIDCSGDFATERLCVRHAGETGQEVDPIRGAA